MLRRPHPLVPLELFRNREFAVINLSTFLIYGALYVGGFYQSVLLQATLGYTATAASLSGFPTGLLLVVLSPRVGTFAGRLGPKPFLVAGPLIMAVGLLWWARIPATSEAWRASLADPGTLLPPVSVLIDVLPALLIFGVGIGFVVAPLTTMLMSSIPTRHAGLGSAINNALSRVGSPLIGAVVFIVVSATFYSALSTRVPDLDTSNPVVRAQYPPLNPPTGDVPPQAAEAAKEASVDAFRVATILAAVLLVSGSAANMIGLRGAPARPDRARSP